MDGVCEKSEEQVITTYMVAKLAGVHQSTVSRVLSGNPKIPEKTVRKVMRACEELSYVPNILAKGFRDSRAYTIALHIPFTAETVFSDPFVPAFLYGIREEAARNKYGVLLSYVDPFDGSGGDFANIIKSRRADGMIIASIRDNDERIRILEEEGIPAAIGHCGQTLPKNVASVDIDNHHCGYLSGRFVVGRKHRRIAILDCAGGALVERDFVDGAMKAILEDGLTEGDVYINYLPDQAQQGCATVCQMLNSSNPPTAIIAHPTMLTLGAMEAIKRSERDVFLLGMGSPLLTQLHPEVPHIVPPAEELGKEMARAVIDIINGQPAAAPKLLYSHIVDEKGWMYQERPSNR